MKVSKVMKMYPFSDGRAVHNWLKAMIILAFRSHLYQRQDTLLYCKKIKNQQAKKLAS